MKRLSILFILFLIIPIVAALPGDMNNDKIVDVFDLIIVGSHFGLTSTDPGWDPRADSNENGVIDIQDMVEVSVNIGNIYSCSADNECTSNNCECADATCSIRVCNAIECTGCKYTTGGGGCGAGNIAVGLDTNDACTDPLSCNGKGICQVPDTQACTSDTDCQSGHFCECADATCSTRVCNAIECTGCKYTAGHGGCGTGNITVGLDPHDACEGDLACDGNGACSTPTPHLDNLVPFYRLYHPMTSGNLFHYTGITSEKDSIIKNYPPWSFDKVLGYISAVKTADTTPLYRLRTPSNSYYLTSSITERDNLQNPPHNFAYNRIVGYSFTSKLSGTQALRRMYKTGSNYKFIHVIDNPNLISYWESQGYEDKGITTYIATQANAGANGINWPRTTAQALKGDMLVGTIYHPGWDHNESRDAWWTTNEWRAINRPYCEGSAHRFCDKSMTSFLNLKPKLGWYDGASPEVLDWEMKWALEHGVQFFMFNWFRNRYTWTCEGDELKYPIDEVLGGALQAFSRSKFKDTFQFAINWVNANYARLSHNRCNPNKLESRSELLDVYYPYWRDNLFNQPQYLRIDGKPVLYIFQYFNLIEDFENDKIYLKSVLDELRAKAVADSDVKMSGLIVVCGEHSDITASEMQDMKDGGCDATYSYHTSGGNHASGVQGFDANLRFNNALKDYRNILPGHFTISVGWGEEPREQPPFNLTPFFTSWWLEPSKPSWGNSYDDVVQWVHGQLPAIPYIGSRRIIMLDAWNEWTEGHYIMPTEKYGFDYLKKIRRWLSAAQSESLSEEYPTGTDLESLQSLWCSDYPSACPYACVDTDGDGKCNGYGDL